jgi:hypothetical protein
MNSKFYIILSSILFSITACTHLPGGGSSTPLHAKNPIVTLSNTNDTLTIGDTLYMHYNLKNPLECEQGLFKDVSHPKYLRVGFTVMKSPNLGDSVFRWYKGFVSTFNDSDTSDPKFNYKKQFNHLSDSIVSFVPTDTGTYSLLTLNDQFVMIQNLPDQEIFSISIDAKFNALDNHIYLMNRYPADKYIYDNYSSASNQAYYFFYVKNP